MVFFARLKKNSSIYNEWRMHNRLSGFIDGVYFKLKGADFVSDELAHEHIEKIKARQDQAIELETVSAIPESLKIVLLEDTPVEEPTTQSVKFTMSDFIKPAEEEPVPKRPRLRKAK